jgi:hypothetical protein
MPAPDGMGALGGSASSSFVRRGGATVAGRPCTEWQTRDTDGHPAVVCITEDGVLLRAGTADQVRVSAVAVRYEPQDAAAFQIPADYVHHAPAGRQ